MSLDITTTYFTAGDFDSRKRYLRKSATGDFVICSGITWEFGAPFIHSNSGFDTPAQPWCGWRWKIGTYGAENFATATLGGVTDTQGVTTPSPQTSTATF